MRIVIVYASTEGQTQKIARHAADRLGVRGHSVDLLEAGNGDDVDLSGFDAAVLAGSVHVGKYQAALSEFARRNAEALAALKTLFLSVSLSAAGDDPGDREGLDECVRRFVSETGWQPGQVEHVAGAFRFTEYDFFRYWAMRWIASQRGQSVSGQQDVEYTDWESLDALLDRWPEG